MRKKSKLTQSVKNDIVQRRLQGETLAEIGREFGISTSTVQYVVDTYRGDIKSEKPDFPAAFSDFEAAIHAALTCKNLGFDSEITASVCKQYQCSHDELKSLCTWYSVNGDLLQKNLEHRLAFSNKQLSKANKAIKTYEGELDTLNKLNSELKLKNTQAEGAVSLLQKNIRECLGKATTFTVEPGTRKIIVDAIVEASDCKLTVKQRCRLVGISNTLFYKWKHNMTE